MSSLNSRVGQYSIHDSEAIKYFEKLQPDPIVLDIVKNGLKLPFISQPGPYYEPNNQSCLTNIEVARKKISTWLKLGNITEVQSRPYCCSPLSVSEKIDYLTGERKKRPCLDLSRHINPLLKAKPLKLDDLNVCEKILEQGDFQACWDLTNAYFHVNVAKEHRKYLGFSLPDETGKVRFYIFNVMVYGMSPAAWVLTALTKPLMMHLHKRGIRSTIYIDDGRVVASSKDKAWSQLKYALKVFESAGWNIQTSKTSTEAVQKLYYQGLWCDTENMTYSVSEIKLDYIRSAIKSLLENPTSKLKVLSSVAGKLTSVVKALGPVIPIMLRSSFIFLAEMIKIHGENAYETNIQINRNVWEDLHFLESNLDYYNGHRIFGTKVGFALNQALEEGDLAEANNQMSESEGIWVSDSSNIKAVSFNPYNPGQDIVIHEFTASQSEMSSSAREYLAVQATVSRLKKDIAASGVQTLYWVTDSQVLSVWLQKGSKIKFIQRSLVQLFHILRELKVQLIPVWVPRESQLIKIADAASKFNDTDDWGISMKGFRILENIFRVKFTCDVFANGTNKKTQKFYSKVAAPGSAGVNAFIQNWSSDFCFVCPPVKLVIDTYRYIQSVPCRGVLVIPRWERNNFWPVITVDGIHFQSEFRKMYEFHPKIITGETSPNSAFSHGNRYRILALLFDSTEENTSPLQDRCSFESCGICS